MAKFAVMGVLLCAEASRQEGTTMFQVGNLATDQTVSRDERLASMKQQIFSLIEAGVPEAALPFLATIKTTLTDDVLPTIVNENDLATTDYNNRRDAFGTAGNAYESANHGVVAAAASAAVTAGEAHDTCRGLESTDYQQTVACRQQESVLQGAYDGDEGTVTRTADALDGGVCEDAIVWRTSSHLAAYRDSVNSHHNAVGALITSRQALDDKQTECTGLDGDLASKNAECNAAQNTFEAAACAQSVAQKEANDQYNSAYNSAQSNFETDIPVWQAQSNDRVTQCQLVHTLVCYITALETHDDQAGLQGAAQACSDNQNSHDCASVTFTEDTATPAQGGLTAIPVAPCDGGFAYGALPDNLSHGTCQACSGL